MTTLEARISELRAAANTLDSSAIDVRNAVNSAHSDVNALIARGFQSPAASVFMNAYHGKKSFMDEWPAELTRFANSLRDAADAIEEAAIREAQQSENVDNDQGQPPPVIPPTGSPPPGGSGPSGQPSGSGFEPGSSGTGGTGPGGTGGSGLPGSGFPGASGTGSGSGQSGGSGSSATDNYFGDEELEGPPPPPPPLEAYVNAQNAPLLQQMEEQQQEIQTIQNNVNALNERRDTLTQELNDLTARMGGAAGVTPNARIRGLQEQIAAIDQEIAGAQDRIDQLSQSISELQTRLERVSPGPGADLDLIASLEGTQTSDAILNATRQSDNSVNCVNWVCSRMPIPPGIPNNAYLWPENALRHPEYGIKMGDVPLAGSVLVMQPEHPFADDRFGHVLFVERVDASGNVWVTDNFNHEPVLLSSLTDVTSGPTMTYMYFPWETQG